MKRKLRFLRPLIFIAVLLAGNAYAGTASAAVVTGRVTELETGEPMPGVNILLKGTLNGTVTDINGEYSIDIGSGNSREAGGAGPVLVFSFIGYATEEVPVNGRTVINVALSPGIESLQEVVVTALGIKREERSLGYSVGKVKGEDINHVTQENVLNSLAGRVPGVVVSSTGAAGSSVNMVIRGAKSLSSDNQPLFVIDGVPVANSLNNVSTIGDDNRVDYGNAIADLNPDNIESISVLKGANAAALYGSRAANGVVMITTKSGAGVKKLTVSLSSNTSVDVPYRFLDFHNKFATGVRPYTPDNNPYGVLYIDEGSVGSNGPELDKGYEAIQWNSPLDSNGDRIPIPLVSHPDNVKNFVQNGITSTNTVAIANSTELMTYRIAYTNMRNRGIIPNSDLFRNTLDMSSSLKVSDKVTVSTNLDFTRSHSNNRPAGNRGTNPMQWAYAVSSHIDITDLEDYWVEGQEGLQQLTQDAGGGEYNNPYFLAHEVNNSFVRDRVYGNIRAEWQITPEISLMGRYSVDTYREQRETKIGNSYTNDPRGAYGIINLNQFEGNADFLATYSKDFDNFHATVSAGGNNRYNKFVSVTTGSKAGTGLITPGVFTLANIAHENLDYYSYLGEKGVYSVYALANLGYRDMVYLDLTARNDWSSTLPAENNSYFYPSASLSLLVNEMLDLPERIGMIKLRSGVGRVGNDTAPYRLINTIQSAGSWGDIPMVYLPSSLLAPDLKPELSTSVEFGLEVTTLNNRLRFEGTYYKVDNENQIIPNEMVPSSGFTSVNTNAGLLTSKGWEFSLGGTPFQKNDWRWDVQLNYSKNTTTIEELSEGVPYYTLWTDAKGGAWTYVGDEIGDIYDAELVTVTDESSPYYGYPILGSDGSWQAVRATNTKNKIGNFNPDFLMGMQSAISYKAFTLSMSFDWRSGGNYVSQTYRYAESDLKTQRFLDLLIDPNGRSGDELRNWLVANADQYIADGINIVGGPTEEYGGVPLGGLGDGVTISDGVFNPGVFAQYDGDGNIIGYTENLGGPGTVYLPFAANYPWDFTRAAMFDASFIKLREISLAWRLPVAFISSLGFQQASVALYGRNIMLWTAAKNGIDPETAFQPEASEQGSRIQFKQGIERYNVTPWTVSTGFKLNITF